ncbi:MAG: Response regulator containing a CheY-like receiver domain and an DNA-binding domain [Jatrophihabitans sp.]|nr:Response regulator containing a CheY-like receiver domain and an DNA-binding domain [Jatrophihabitans sp.]
MAAAVLGGSPLPAFVLDVPSDRIVAASLRAAQMLSPGAGEVVGHQFAEFTADHPALGSDLVAGARLNGFESFRLLRRTHGPDLKIRLWVRNFENVSTSRYVLVLIVADRAAPADASERGWQDAPAVVGIANSGMRIERVSAEAELLFGRRLTELIGMPLLRLISDDDTQPCLTAMAEASASGKGVTLHVDTRVPTGTASHRNLSCELLILPLQPAPACAFVFLPTTARSSGVALSDDLSAILDRLGRGAEIAQLARGVLAGISELDMPGLSRLTTRELEIVTGLLQGDRPPGIARRLFVSQSTVRNHLASVFAKIGVSSQQDLIDKFRAARSVSDQR